MRWRVDIGKQPAGVLTLFFYAWSLASCLQTPSPQLRMPEVVSVEESADYASVELTATLDHTGNVKQAGFYLWRDAGEKRHQEGTLAGNTLAVRWEGLEPKTEYHYAVFFSNGQTEQMSNSYRFITSELPMPGVAGVEVTPTYCDATFRVRLTGEQFLAGECLLTWWPKGGDVRQQVLLEDDGSGSLVCKVSDLQPETDYLYSITLSNGTRSQESAPASFRTLEAPYNVELSMQVVPQASGALLAADFTTPDGVVPAPCGFLYREASAEEWLRVACMPAGKRIEAEVQGLSPETEYLFCVWYTLKGEEVRSEPDAFRTLEAPEPEPEPEPEPDPHPLPANAFDPALLDYLLGHFDDDSDGVLTDVELSKVLELDISDILLESHNGLEFLTALETLYTGDNWLARFDLRANTRLKSLIGGRSAHLQEIILDNPELLLIYIISAQNLQSLDFTKCPRLYICQWYDVGLESVDLSRNQDLYHLEFGGTKLKELDLSACIRLKILKSENNPDLQTIWLKKGILLDSCEVDAHTEIKYK